MKPLILTSIALIAALALSGCGPAEARTSERPPENGAQYKKDKGIVLTFHQVLILLLWRKTLWCARLCHVH